MATSTGSERPMSGAGRRVFYGWYIIAACVLGICFGFVGVTIYAFSAFVLPLTDEFGWSRGAISFGITLAHVTAAVVLVPLGMLIDRKGVRGPLLVSTFLFGCILCLFYFLNSHIALFYAGMVTLTALGSGTQSVSYVRLIVTWFDRKKGLALALGVSGAGVGALILPPLVSWIIRQSGWRTAYLALGLINLVLILPLLFFIVRNSPADINSYPDGVPPAAADGRAAPRAIEQQGRRFTECIRTPVFWKLAAATLLLGLSLNGSISQIIPLLVDRGVARHDAGNLAALLGLSVIISRLIAGSLLDRFHAPFVAAVLLLCPVLGFAGLAFLSGPTAAALTLVAVGIGLGLEFDALGYFCAHYFGRLALGTIYSALFVLFTIGGAIGSYFAGYSFDLFKSYTPLLACSAVITFIAVLFTASLGRPVALHEYPVEHTSAS
jgi:sugar phosphate permease